MSLSAIRRIFVVPLNLALVPQISFAHLSSIASIATDPVHDSIVFFPESEDDGTNIPTITAAHACHPVLDNVFTFNPLKGIRHFYSRGDVSNICKGVSFAECAELMDQYKSTYVHSDQSSMLRASAASLSNSPTASESRFDGVGTHHLFPLALRAAALRALRDEFPHAQVVVCAPAVDPLAVSVSEGAPGVPLAAAPAAAHVAAVAKAAALFATSVPVAAADTIARGGAPTVAPLPLPWQLAGVPPLASSPKTVDAAVRKLHSGGAATLEEFKLRGADLLLDAAAVTLAAAAACVAAWGGGGAARSSHPRGEGGDDVVQAWIAAALAGAARPRSAHRLHSALAGPDAPQAAPVASASAEAAAGFARCLRDGLSGVGKHAATAATDDDGALGAIVMTGRVLAGYARAEVMTGDVKQATATTLSSIAQWHAARAADVGAGGCGERTVSVFQRRVAAALHGTV